MFLVVGLAIAPAHAQATRTWVSGVGNDANPCSRTAPCKTWAGAISKTAAGGEIDALDPGGFGALTITKSITLDGGGGQVASTLVSGTNAMTIAAAATDVVILRNVRFNGLLNSVSPGLVGIQVSTAARVVIEKCDIFGFSTAAVSVIPSSGTVAVKIQETTINNNDAGVLAKPTGGATVNMSIDHSFIDANAGGALKIDGTGGGSSNVSINDSSLSLNAANGVNGVSGASGNVKIDLTRVTIGQKWRRRRPGQQQQRRHRDGDGRRIDAVEQRQRVAGAQRCVLAQLLEQSGDRSGRHGSFRRPSCNRLPSFNRPS